MNELNRLVAEQAAEIAVVNIEQDGDRSPIPPPLFNYMCAVILACAEMFADSDITLQEFMQDGVLSAPQGTEEREMRAIVRASSRIRNLTKASPSANMRCCPSEKLRPRLLLGHLKSQADT